MKHIALGVLLTVVTLGVGTNVAAAQETGSCYVFNNDLTYGMTSGEVLELQKVLNSKGVLAAEANGTFGPATRAAVARYQASIAVSPTGFFGPATRAGLNARCGEVLGDFASETTTYGSTGTLALTRPEAGTYEAGSLVAFKWTPSRTVSSVFAAYEFGLVDSSNKLTKLKDFTAMNANTVSQPADNVEQLNRYRVVKIPRNLPAGEYRAYIKFKPDNISAYGATITVVKKGGLDGTVTATTTQDLPLIVELPVTGTYEAGSKIAFQWSNDDKKMMSTSYRAGVVDEDGVKIKLEGSRSSPEGSGSVVDGRVHFFREVSITKKFTPGTYKTFVENRKTKEIGYGPEITIVTKGSAETPTTPTQPGTTTDSTLRSSGTGRFRNPSSPLLVFAPKTGNYQLGKTVSFGWEAHASALAGMSTDTEFEFGLQDSAGTMNVLTKVPNGNTYMGSSFSLNNNTEARNGWIVGRRVAKLPATLAAGTYKPFVRIKQNGAVAYGDSIKLVAKRGSSNTDDTDDSNDDSDDQNTASGTTNQQGTSSNTGGSSGSSATATVTPNLNVEKTKTGSVVVTVGPALKPDKWRYTITCSPAKSDVDGCPVSATVNNKTVATYVKQKLYELPASVFSKFEAATVKVEALNKSGVVMGSAMKTVGQTGAVSASTPQALASDVSTYSAYSAIGSLPDLQAGATHEGVAMIQRFLNANGFAVGTSAGQPGSVGYEANYFGPATQKALAAYQASRGIPATGTFGPVTRAAMAATRN